MQIPDPRPAQNIPKSVNYKETELGIIPQEWNIGKLQDYAAKIGSGITPRGGSQVYLKEGIPLIRSQNVHFDGLKLDDVAYISQEMHNEMENTKLRDNDVLLNITGASLGRCTFVPPNFGEGNVNQHVCIIRPNPNLNSIFLSNFLSSHLGQKMIFRVPNGLSREGLTFKEIGLLPIFIPPIKEQEKVASILSKVDELIQKTDHVIEQTQRLKKGLMQRLLTKGIGHTKFKKTPIGEIPEEWEIKSIGDLLKERVILELQDGNHGELHPKQQHFRLSGIPFITANCITNNRISFDKCQFLPEEWLKKLRIGFAKGNDVILTHKGTLGLTAIVPQDKGIVILSPQTTYYRLSNRLSTRFLYYVFQSGFMHRQLHNIGKQSTRDYVGITSQRGLLVPFISIKEQEKIATIICLFDSQITNEQNLKSRIENLKRGLMQNLLTGRIRVKL